ncbi:MAG: hypothetical protein HYY16_11045 [Planctomycetes bacterium]|nr:hypothetical protein [Planctomycetota bacterium]
MGVEKYDELARLVQEARLNYEEFAAGKKVAAIRARQALQQIKRVSQECRIEIQQIKKGPEEQKPTAPPA